MTAAQQHLVQSQAHFEGSGDADLHPLPPGDLAQAVYRLSRSVAKGYDEYGLSLDFPSMHGGTVVELPVAKP